MFLLSMVILLIGGGVALLWQNQQGNSRAQAADVSVISQPTLSAATVDAIFARVGSPMLGTGKAIEQASRQTGVDDAFALAVYWTETNDGAAGVGRADRNPGSVRGSVGYPSAYDGYTIYPSYTAAINYWFNMLRNNYANRGLSTVYAIARPYVGTSSYPLWAGKVIALMYNYRGIAPPPPVSTPRPKPTVNPAIVAAYNARMHKLASIMQSLYTENAAAPTNDPGSIQAKIVPSTSTPQSTNIAPALPRAAELGVVLFGLLAALAIALFSLKMPVVRLQQRTFQVEQAQAIASTPLHEYAPSTDDLPVLPTPIAVTGMLSLPTRNRVTEALPRRIVLVPAHIDPQTPIPADAGSRLLSRYRQNNDHAS